MCANQLPMPAKFAEFESGCRAACRGVVSVGDMLNHTHCDALSLVTQRAGLEALSRLLGMLRAARSMEGRAEIRYCLASSACYLLCWTAREGDPPRDYHDALLVEAARAGWMQEILQILSAPSAAIPSEDRDE
jgi:hypothetical protein